MGEEFVVDTSYSGYVFVGWAAGQFENDRGEKVPYASSSSLRSAQYLRKSIDIHPGRFSAYDGRG